MRKLLFVCSGNTCRSPLALAAWRALQAEGASPADVAGDCAGLMAVEGEAASPHAVFVARDWNQDLSTHKSKFLAPEIAQSADWIVAMNDAHVAALRDHFPSRAEKFFLLGAFDPRGGNPEILDPFGGSREAYETCAARIRRAVAGLAEAIERGEIK